MTESMETRLACIFAIEIQKQCTFALMGADDLKNALRASAQDRVWFAAQAILISLGNVSKILWPTKSAARGAYLRTLLHISDDSPLASRKLRNNFEHIDERMEAWYERHGRHKTSVDGGIAPSNGYTATQGDTFFRWFDTTLFAVTFCGELFPLVPLLYAARQLRDEADRAIEHLLRLDYEAHRPQ